MCTTYKGPLSETLEYVICVSHVLSPYLINSQSYIFVHSVHGALSNKILNKEFKVESIKLNYLEVHITKRSTVQKQLPVMYCEMLDHANDDGIGGIFGMSKICHNVYN